LSFLYWLSRSLTVYYRYRSEARYKSFAVHHLLGCSDSRQNEWYGRWDSINRDEYLCVSSEDDSTWGSHICTRSFRNWSLSWLF
jgi:hypothetical protein